MSTTIKYKLDDFAEANESILIGIISSSPDYTVCWHINKQLQINLSRCADLKFDVIQKNKNTYFYFIGKDIHSKLGYNNHKQSLSAL